MSWLKKHWWKLLIVPAVLLGVYHLIRLLFRAVISRAVYPDTSDLDGREKQDERETNRKLTEELKTIGQEKDQAVTNIREGQTTPAEIFNKETDG